MKYILSLSMIFYSMAAVSQDIPMKDGKAFYESIDSSVTGTQKELYQKARLWIADAFKDAQEVIQLDDAEHGELLGKGNFSWTQGLAPYRCKFSVKISVRDNKYRCQIYDIILVGGTREIESPIEYVMSHNRGAGIKKILARADDGIRSIIESVHTAMNKQPDSF